MYRLPAVISHLGKTTQELSQKRRDLGYEESTGITSGQVIILEYAPNTIHWR